ncbi:MAG: hypothetical protein RDU01_04925 [Thermodesulfovibrionales bacterium]|nr:hypothetical protein [Thermodesulfovibrionales bacterium]
MKIIDIHTHGVSGYDTRTADSTHILKIAKIHGSSGVSDILLAVYPSSLDVMRNQMETIKKAIGRQKAGQDARKKTKKISLPEIRHQGSAKQPVFTESSMRGGKSARILGVHLEGPFVNPSKCGALNAAHCRKPSLQDFRKLLEGYEDIVKIMTVAPELNGSLKLIRHMTGQGIIVSMGHSDATYAEAEAGFHAGARGITHLFNAMRGFQHREPGIAGFGLMNQEVYLEVIADPHHLHPGTLDLIFRTKNPEKIIIVSDTVKGTKRAGGGRPVTGQRGKLLGGSMTVTASVQRLIEAGYRKRFLMRCITKNPERYLSFSQ